MHVIVSGAAGHLGRVLLPQLCATDGIDRVTGIDLQPIRYTHPRLHAVQADAASERAREALAGADALVHLAFVLLRGRRDGDAMRRANVGAAETLLGAAADAGVGRLIFLSSAAVYGQGENLRETADLEPLTSFLYARHKVECERWLAAQLPQAAVLRPHIILGPNAVPLLKRLAASRLLPRLPHPHPRLQCVHEEDVAQAIVAALLRDVRGPFNLAAAEDFSLQELVSARRAKAVALPLPVLRAGLSATWRLTGWGGEPGWLEGVRRTLTLDCSRARTQLDWQPRHERWQEILASTFAKP